MKDCSRPRALALLAALGALGLAPPARALQPLQTFLESSQRTSVDALEAQANLAQQDAQKDLALGRVLPGLTARGTLTINQYESTVNLGPGQPSIIIVPKYQWDGLATLTVPLIDLAGFQRVSAAKTAVGALDQQLRSIRLLIEAAVAQDYYQLAANLALVTAAQRALEVSRQSLQLAVNRRDAGAGLQLDVDRAQADVEQQTQQVASAQLQIALAAQALETASGVVPEETPIKELNDNLQEEKPLAAFESEVEKLPSVAAAVELTRTAEAQARAQKLTFLPTLAGTLSERGTSAPGFTGNNFTWQAVLGLSWSLDFTTFANVRLQEAGVEVARAREQRVRLAARDAIQRQWATISASLTRSRSARAGLEAAEHASTQAQDRYQAGTITQLDLLQAQRDAFAAQVSRIQADADLINARAQLKLASGSSLLASGSTAQVR